MESIKRKVGRELQFVSIIIRKTILLEITFGQSDRCDLSRFDWLAVEGDEKKGVSVDEDSYWTGSSTTGVGQAESVTSSREHGELGERDPRPVRLAPSSVHQKDGWFRVAGFRERDLARMLPLAHQNHVTRVVDVVQRPVRIPYVRLLHYQRPEYAVRDVVPCKSRSILSLSKDLDNFANNNCT